MRCIRLRRAVWRGVLTLCMGLPAFGLAAEVQRQAAGSGNAGSGSRGTVISRGGAAPTGSVRSPSIASPRVPGTLISGPGLNGTNAASRVPSIATSNGAAGQVIRGGNNGWASPVAGGVGSPVAGGVGSPVMGGIGSPAASGIGQIANRPPVPYGGVQVNPGRNPVNPTMGWGPVVRPNDPSSVYPPPDTNSEWYRRYQDRGKYPDGYNGGHYGNDWPYGYGYGYPYGYGYGPYGPVFMQPTNIYYNVQNVGDVNDQDDADAAEQPAEKPGRAREPQRKRPVAALGPDKLHDLMTEGVKLFRAGKYNESAAKFMRVTMADRLNVDATLAYAVARFATGDYQIAGLAVRRGVRRMPEVVDSNFDVRGRYTNPDHFQDHLARLEQFVRDNPDNEDAWTVLGFIRHFSGQRELAVETFRRLRGFPGADAEVAEIFLAAKPVEAAAQSPPAAAVPQTQPADLLPMVPAGHDRPLPEAVAESLAEELISIEPAD